MLKPGDLLNGYEILTSHRNLTDSTKGTILAYSEEKGNFVVSSLSEDSLKSGEWHQGHYFESYTNAMSRFYEIVDEEAFLVDSGEI